MDFPPIEGYKCKGELGGQGSRTAFLVRHSEQDRESVIKVFRLEDIHPNIARYRGVHTLPEIFRLEIGILKDNPHPNIVACYHGDSVGDTYFIEEEYMAGGDIAQHLPGLSTGRALNWFTQMLEGVAHLHKVPIVLRDLKLENVLSSGDRRIVKIDDLELASTLEGSLEKTPRSMVSRRYRAPELDRDRPATTQTDIYSLGCCLFYLLSGEVESLREINQIQDSPHHKTAVSNVLMSSGVPDEYHQPIMGALAWDPAARFENVQQLRAAVIEAENSVAGRNYNGSDCEALLQIYRNLGDTRNMPTGFGEIVVAGAGIRDVEPRSWHDDVYIVCERREQVEGFLRIRFHPRGESLISQETIEYDCILAPEDNAQEVYNLLISHADRKIDELIQTMPDRYLISISINVPFINGECLWQHA